MTSDDVPDGWIPLPPGWVHHDRRVVTRRAHDQTLRWFPTPDPSGYDGIALALIDSAAGACEFWMWTDESGDRAARIVRLGRGSFVVELHSAHASGVLEDPRRDAREHRVTADARDVLGRDAVSPAQTFSSPFSAESAARLWVDRGEVHEGTRLRPWAEPSPDR